MADSLIATSWGRVILFSNEISDGRVSGKKCCGPPSLPMRGHSMRGVREEERKQEERHDEESMGCSSPSPVSSHYQRP